MSAVAYRELTFQAIYATNQGNPMPLGSGPEGARRTDRRVLESKFLVSGLLAGMAVLAAVALSPRVQIFLGPGVPEPVYRAAVLSAALLLELSFLWTVGLQILPTFLGSRILPTLATLPLPAEDRDRAALLVFLRLFDLPILTLLVLMPLLTGLALRSVVGGLALLPGVVATVLLALGLALATGDHFVRRVQSSPTGRSASAVRWGFLLLWALPAFAVYAFVSFSPELLGGLATLAVQDPRGLAALMLLFPFPYALLPSLALPGGAAALGLGPWAVPLVLLSAVAYAFALAALAGWLKTAPGRLGLRAADTLARPAPVGRLRVRGVAAAVILKDLRIASRSPAFAYVVILPILDAAVLGLATFVGDPSPLAVFRLGAAAVAASALLATFFGPAFFATEVMGSSYVRTLPLPPRLLLTGKTGLIVAVYTASALLVVGFTLARVFAPGILLLFVLAELPAVAAAALFEMALLHRVSERRGITLTNLYTGAWWATAAALPGLLLAGGPLLAYELEPARLPAVGFMALAALAELAAILAVAARWTRRGPG